MAWPQSACASAGHALPPRAGSTAPTPSPLLQGAPTMHAAAAFGAAVAPAARAAASLAAQAVAPRDSARATASLDAAWLAFGMPPTAAPFAANAFSGQPIAAGAPTAHAAAAFVATVAPAARAAASLAATHAAQAVAPRDSARATASLDAAWLAFRMPPAAAPFAANAFSGQPIAASAATAGAAPLFAQSFSAMEQTPPFGHIVKAV
ncbi:antifreeze protein Maxi-like [Panicum virgatum]|uniref:antifreeze protein Maxi-like n=1 Tax=Panicum virgatum TaxID=38727 RepID=UPI0019D5036D|nr:antifreeze protein Maxi-like [Panicum virgatum]